MIIFYNTLLVAPSSSYLKYYHITCLATLFKMNYIILYRNILLFLQRIGGTMKKYLKMLETIALFNGIDRDNFETLLHCLKAKIVYYNKDDIIFMTGEKINNLGIVLSGQVQIIQNDYYGNKCII